MPDDVENLVARCLRGDPDAWPALINTYAGLVYAIARQHALTESQADDVAQTVFAQLVRSLASVQQPRALPGWLSTTTRRECWRLLSSRSRENLPLSAHSSEAGAHDLTLESLERAQEVRDALDQLDPRCRDLLWRIFLGPQPPDYTRLSTELAMPMGSIGPTRKRCLAKLANLLEDRS